MEDSAGSVGDGELVRPGREAPPLLDVREGSLNDGAVLVGLGIEQGWPATIASFAFAGGELIALLGDHGRDAAGAEHAPIHALA